jgi:hypothetical protein
MSILDDVRAKLHDVKPGGTLVLSAAAIDVPPVTRFFLDGLKVDSLTLANASTDRAGDPIVIKGKGKVLDYPDLAVNLTFRMLDGFLAIRLDGAFPSGKNSLQLPLLDWIHLEDLGLTLSQTGAYDILDFAFRGNILPDPNTVNTAIPISLSPAGNDAWALSIAAENDVPLGSIGNLTKLLHVAPLSSFLPEDGFKALNDITLGHIAALFSIERKAVYYFTIQVGVSNGWSIVPDTIGIEEKSLKLILTLVNPTDASSRQTIGIVRGTFDINRTKVPVFVQAAVGRGSTNWMVGLDPATDGVTLPSFSDLFVFAGGKSFKDTLPSFLRKIPRIRVPTLEIDFSLQPRSLQLLMFAAETTAPWPLIDDFLTVEKLSFELVLLDLDKGEKDRKIGGRVSTTIIVSESVWLFFDAFKDPANEDWNFSGGLPPDKSINLTEIVGTLLQDVVKLPPQVPVITFDTLEIHVVPDKTMALTAGSKSSWDLLPKLALTTFSLDGMYDQQLPSNRFSGSLSTSWKIGSVPVDIKATLDNTGSQGWDFEGSTKDVKLPVSSFLKETFDGVFPGREGSVSSGVPPILNVTIKSLDARFNTQTKDFHFDAEINFGTKAKTSLTFSNLHQEGADTFERRAKGTLSIELSGENLRHGPQAGSLLEFELGLDLKPDAKHFVASYNNPDGKPISLKSLVEAMLPASVDAPDFHVTIKDAIVGYKSDESGAQAVFAIDLGASVDLTKLEGIPIVGQSLSEAKTLNLAFQLAYPTGKGQAFPHADLEALNALITDAGPKFPADKALQDLFVKTELRLGDGNPITFSLPVQIDKSNGQLKDQSSSNNGLAIPGSQETDDGVKWLQLDKKFGPVHLQRVGFSYDNGTVGVLLDGGITALGLEVDLMGLSVSSKLTDAHPTPQFKLDGLGIRFAKGGVEIAGALLHLHLPSGDEYDGLAVVQAEGLRLAAVGSLTNVDGHASLFLYAMLDYPLGGAPFFYVTGLAGGFGLNRQLVMPPVDQVRDFPLIADALKPPAMPPDLGSAGDFITKQLGTLSKDLVPRVGQYFGCAGVHFTSFELLDSFVLVSLSFGREFELDLLGVSSLVVPPKDATALAVITLQIAASFIPDQGIAIVQGQLTKDSHVLDPKCLLTGGFAFAAWFGPNPHSGDFVVTLGGYHPEFQKPDHYPNVPRIGVNWQISPNLSVNGGLYFALTPMAMMAGGALHAVFQYDYEGSIASAEVKAWFILGADFIVYWKPFHYKAHVYVDMGIDVVIHFLGTHELGFDAGADLEVWGSPFAGRAHVSFKIIGITIGFNVAFGQDASEPDPLVWDDRDASKSFKQSFLPDDSRIVSAAVGAGLVRKVDHSTPSSREGRPRDDVPVHNGDDAHWQVVNPTELKLRTNSVIPIKRYVFGESTNLNVVDVGGNANFGIASMHKGSASVETLHQITVTRESVPAESSFELRPIMSHVPGGLWAEKNSDDLNASRLIENAVIGFEIIPAKKEPDKTTPIKIDRKVLSQPSDVVPNAYSDLKIGSFSETEKPAHPDDPAANRRLWKIVQSEIHNNPRRDAMLSAMSFAKTDLDIGEPFDDDSAYAPHYGVLA